MSFSKILRRSHMYLALFLMPWMLMYTLSTFVMNHRDTFIEMLGGEKPNWVFESQQQYDGAFSLEADRNDIAQQILSDLRMDGRHRVGGNLESGKITIDRNDPLTPRRITFHAETRQVLVERRLSTPNTWLEQMHRRRDFNSDYMVDDSWAVSVDIVILAMVFWVLSGLWMWWEVKLTRRMGSIVAIAGAGLFIMFIMAI